MIKVFSKFLDEDVLSKKYSKIDEILDLPISSYKFLNKAQSDILSELLNITEIGDAAKLDKDNPFKKIIKDKKKSRSVEDPSEDVELKFEIYKKKHPDLELNLKKVVSLSSLITEIKDEVKDFEKDTQKVIVVGLDNAGKTAIISKVGSIKGIDDLTSLEPTKGVNRKKVEKSNLDLYIWDLGGQKTYRDKYLKDPEKYFLEIDLLLYVIDVQDPDRFEESFEYFDKILEILIILEENPYILILIHKTDPDIRESAKIKLNIELLKEKINNLFYNKKYPLDYQTYTSSIYTKFSKEPQFSNIIKDVINANYSLTDPTVRKVEGLARTLEETMNAFIRLSESISEQLNEIDARLNAIESGAFHIAQSGVPIEIRTSDQIKEKTEENVRGQVLQELKDLFDKKRSLDH